MDGCNLICSPPLVQFSRGRFCNWPDIQLTLDNSNFKGNVKDASYREFQLSEIKPVRKLHKERTNLAGVFAAVRVIDGYRLLIHEPAKGIEVKKSLWFTNSHSSANLYACKRVLTLGRDERNDPIRVTIVNIVVTPSPSRAGTAFFSHPECQP